MKLDAARSILLIVDLQERLLPAIDHGASVIEHATWLIGVARQLQVPILLTEQYPQGLGPTAPAIARPFHGSRLLPFEVSLSRRAERIVARCIWPNPLDLAHRLPRACPPASGAADPLAAPVSVRRERLCMTLSIN